MESTTEKTDYAGSRRKISVTTVSDVLDRARWIEENRDAFIRQGNWHEGNDHPFARIAAGPLADAV